MQRAITMMLGSWLISSMSVCLSPVAMAQQDAVRELLQALSGATWELAGNEETQDTYEPVLGGHFIRFTTTGRDNPPGLGIIGKHPDTGHWTWWVFRADGNVEVGELAGARAEAGGLDISYKSLTGTTAFQYRFEFSEESTSMTGSGAISGQALPAAMTWNRQKLADQAWLTAKAPQPYPPQLEFCRGMEGPKLLQLNFDGQNGTGGSYGRWILDGQFFYYAAAHVMPDGKPWSHLVVMGKNPASGQYSLWEFNSDGDVSLAHPGPDGKSLTGEVTLLTGGTQAYRGKMQEVGGMLRYAATIDVDGEAKPYTWTWLETPDAR